MKENKGKQLVSKVSQLVEMLSCAIDRHVYEPGDFLPSINSLSEEYQVSRDTVFKAFRILKSRKLIESYPGKGYYVNDHLVKVLLLLDQYSSFKVTLYNSFIRNLPANYKVDMLFHQYSESLFNTIIRDSIGKYNKYVVMNFNNEKFSDILATIHKDKLLLLDFGKFDKKDYSYVCQDFDEGFYQALMSIRNLLHKYREIDAVFGKEEKHPRSSLEYLRKFCEEEQLGSRVIESLDHVKVEKGVLYIVMRQRDIVKIIKSGREERLVCGKDFGLLAYNDMPVFEVIDCGITSMTIDWEEMGQSAADFVRNDTPVHKFLPTKIILRHSV